MTELELIRIANAAYPIILRYWDRCVNLGPNYTFSKVKLYFVRDYRDYYTKEFGFATGIWWSFSEPVRYVSVGIRGIGRVEAYWGVYKDKVTNITPERRGI